MAYSLMHPSPYQVGDYAIQFVAKDYFLATKLTHISTIPSLAAQGLVSESLFGPLMKINSLTLHEKCYLCEEEMPGEWSDSLIMSDVLFRYRPGGSSNSKLCLSKYYT